MWWLLKEAFVTSGSKPEPCSQGPHESKVARMDAGWRAHLHCRGRIRKVGLDEICRWISDAWEDIPPEMIQKSFRKCCITNALDGTEDDEIWEEEDDSDPFEDLDEMEGEDDFYYADDFERQQAEIGPECYENIFGESDSEDFYGF